MSICKQLLNDSYRGGAGVIFLVVVLVLLLSSSEVIKGQVEEDFMERPLFLSRMNEYDLSVGAVFKNINPPPLNYQKKKTLIQKRTSRLVEISELAASYVETEDMLKVEMKYGDAKAISARKAKLYNIGNLINGLHHDIEIIDKYCENRIGENCETPTCYGKWQEGPISPCNGNGACIDADNCLCNEGYFGNECTVFSCFGQTSNSSTVCSGRGMCTQLDSCVCSAGFYGDNCEFERQTSSHIIKRQDQVRILDVSYIPESCKEYFNFITPDNAADVDGYYLINPQRSGEFVVYCDMTNGGWTLLNEASDVYSARLLLSDQLERVLMTMSEVKSSFGEVCFVDFKYSDNIVRDPLMRRFCESFYAKYSLQYTVTDLIASPHKYWIK